MARASKFSKEVRERAVRMVLEHRGEYGSEWEAMGSIASKIGCTAETLRKWVRQTEVDSGRRGGLTTEEQARMKELAAKVERSRGTWSGPVACIGEPTSFSC
jgi:transposase